MATFLKCLLLCLFAIVVFARDFFPSQILYWATYVVMFATVGLWWYAAYWISVKKAQQFLKKTFDSSFFVGMVAEDVNDDLIRGRFCIIGSELMLLIRDGKSYKIAWTENLANIKCTDTGTVVGWRKGFSIYTDDGKYSFVTKNGKEIVKVLGK